MSNTSEIHVVENDGPVVESHSPRGASICRAFADTPGPALLKFRSKHSMPPESIWGLLESLRDDAFAVSHEANATRRPHLLVTIREMDLILAELREPSFPGRPLWPRAIAVIARLIEDGLMQ
jgi:hypothetical protein